MAVRERSEEVAATAVAISHGPIVGAVSDTTVKIWARAEGVVPETYSLAVEYGETDDPIGTISSAVILAEGADFTGTIDLEGLAAATDHWYRLVLDDVVVAGSDGSFTTLPPLGEPLNLRFAFGSCNDHLQMPYPIFPVILQQNPAFFLHLGDIIYADRAPAAAVQSEFEERYKLNFQEVDWRSFMSQIPSFMTWDDHEIVNDWASGQTGLYLEARPAFDEYVASRNPAPRLPGQLYYDFSAGDVDFFVLDTRSFRDPGVPSMLGATQLDELESWLSSSAARFKIIVSSIQWSYLTQNLDTWYGYQSERDAIFELVRKHSAGGVVLLSGDRHWIGVFRHETVAPYFLYELSSSPLGATVGSAPAADAETLFLSDSSRAFMVVDVDTTVTPATLTARVIDAAGAELYVLPLTVDDISPLFANGFESGDTAAWSATAP